MILCCGHELLHDYLIGSNRYENHIVYKRKTTPPIFVGYSTRSVVYQYYYFANHVTDPFGGGVPELVIQGMQALRAVMDKIAPEDQQEMNLDSADVEGAEPVESEDGLSVEGLEALDVPELERRTEQCCEQHRSALCARQWRKASGFGANLSKLTAALERASAAGGQAESLVACPGEGKGKGKGAPSTGNVSNPY